MKTLIVAIDGPSGAGKGTVSRALAQALGYRHIDTGAMYRAVGWKAHHDGIQLTDEPAVAHLARSADLTVEGGVVAIDGHDVTRVIRTAEVDKFASTVAKLPQVREVLVARQRALGGAGRCRDGRARHRQRRFSRRRREDLSRRLCGGTGPAPCTRCGSRRKPGRTGGGGRSHRGARSVRHDPRQPLLSRSHLVPHVSTRPTCRSRPSSIASWRWSRTD